jgi:hypothetical protein
MIGLKAYWMELALWPGPAPRNPTASASHIQARVMATNRVVLKNGASLYLVCGNVMVMLSVIPLCADEGF